MKGRTCAQRCALAFASLVFPFAGFSAAWLQPKGNPLLITSSDFSHSCQYWDSNAKLHGAPCVNGYTLNPYFEYGLTSKIDIGQNSFFRSVRTEYGDASFSIADLVLFAKFEVWKNQNSVLSTRLAGNIPFDHPNYEAPNLQPQISLGQYWVELRGLYGILGHFSFLPESTWFANFELGYQENFNGAADQINIEIYLGWRGPKRHWELELKSSNVVSMQNPTLEFAPNFDASIIMPGVIYWFTPQIGLEVGTYQGIYGTEARKTSTPFVSLWLTGKQTAATARR